VPILAYDEACRADLADLPLPRIETRVGPSWMPDGDLFLCDDEDETGRMISDQAPFGDFTPGRFAWLLEDVESTTERCPRCWGEGGWHEWTSATDTIPHRCPTCDGGQFCAPVPMKGRQRLWTVRDSDWGASK
jgi:hypothetical protein